MSYRAKLVLLGVVLGVFLDVENKEANHLGMMRTGAAGGVAAKWLARPDARVAGIFGAGWQAQGQLEALAAVRKLARVKVWSRTRLIISNTATSMPLTIDVTT